MDTTASPIETIETTEQLTSSVETHPNPTLADTTTDQTAPSRKLVKTLKKLEQHDWVMFSFKLVAAMMLMLVFLQLVVPFYVVHGQSMEPNYHNGEITITDRAFFKLFGQLQRNDVVIFNEPGYSEILIKRIIGLPGDSVRISKSNVYLNNQLLDEPFIQFKSDYNYGPTKVPTGQYFVMGDNRPNSRDSHYFGCVPDKNIIARVLFSLF